MAKNAHLTLDDRATIEISLREGKSFTEMGKELGKDPSTISKEIKNHSQPVRKGSYNPCAKRTSCSHMGKACMFATAAIHAFVVNLSVIFMMPRRLKRNTNQPALKVVRE